MKLRQKLAVVLASAMVTSAVPVVTMASSTNSLAKSSITVKEDAIATTGTALKIKFTSNDSKESEEFYLKLENAEWDEDALAAGSISHDGSKYVIGIGKNGETAIYDRQDSDTVRVVIASGVIADDETNYTFPLITKLTGGDAKVTIESEGSTATTVSSGSFVFGSTSEDKFSYSVSDTNTFYDRGQLGKFTFKETYTGSLSDGAVVEIQLDDADWEFISGDKFTLKGAYGFSNYGKKDITVKSVSKSDFNDDKGLADDVAIINTDDKGSIKIKLPKYDGSSLGRYEVEGLDVKCTEDEPAMGDLLADIKGDDIAEEGNGVVVGKVADYSYYIKMDDDKVVDIKAGKVEDVKFKVGENVDDSFRDNSEVEITLDNEDAFFYIDYKSNGDYKNLISDTEEGLAKTITSVEVEWDDEDDAKKDGKGKAEKIIVNLADDLENDEEDWFEVDTKIYVPIDQKDKGGVKIIADGRAMNEKVEQEAVKIVNPFDITFEAATLKVGLQKQVAGKLVLTETDKEMFEKGDLFIQIDEDKNKGLDLTDEGKLVVSGDLKNTDFEDDCTTKEGVKVTLNRQSKAASTLTISDMEITTDRTVPEGTYDLKLSGPAIDELGGDITVEDFIVIGTPNTQDIGANGLAKGTATFVIGENKYTLNGSDTEMDAASYIQDPGYTMIPVRYVAKAFGVAESDILFSAGTATIFAGSRTVQLTSGSATAVVNGASVQMGTKVVIKDGRTYAPVGEIARILGIATSWDATSKTATFTNK